MRVFLGREPRRREDVRFCRGCNSLKVDLECGDCGGHTWPFDERFVKRFPRCKMINLLPLPGKEIRMPGDYKVRRPKVLLGGRFEGKRERH
jgi:hypothetical protein